MLPENIQSIISSIHFYFNQAPASSSGGPSPAQIAQSWLEKTNALKAYLLNNLQRFETAQILELSDICYRGYNLALRYASRNHELESTIVKQKEDLTQATRAYYNSTSSDQFETPTFTTHPSADFMPRGKRQYHPGQPPAPPGPPPESAKRRRKELSPSIFQPAASPDSTASGPAYDATTDGSASPISASNATGSSEVSSCNSDAQAKTSEQESQIIDLTEAHSLELRALHEMLTQARQRAERAEEELETQKLSHRNEQNAEAMSQQLELDEAHEQLEMLKSQLASARAENRQLKSEIARLGQEPAIFFEKILTAIQLKQSSLITLDSIGYLLHLRESDDTAIANQAHLILELMLRQADNLQLNETKITLLLELFEPRSLQWENPKPRP